MARSYRMTPARRAALRKAQAASARKRKGSGKAKTKRISPRTRRRVKAGAKLAGAVALYAGANAIAIGAARSSANRRSSRTSARNRAHINSQIRRTTGTSPRVMTGARAHGGGPTSANRVFVGTRHGSVSVRRRHH